MLMYWLFPERHSNSQARMYDGSIGSEDARGIEYMVRETERGSGCEIYMHAGMGEVGDTGVVKPLQCVVSV